MDNYLDWEENLTSTIVENMDCSRSDGQALLEAENVYSFFVKGFSPEETYKAIWA